MPFAGKECLRKLRNEDKETFDILCRRRGAGLVQQRCRIIKQARKKRKMEKGGEKRRIMRTEVSSTPHQGGDERCLSAHHGEDRMKSSALALNYGPAARMALQKSSVDFGWLVPFSPC